MQFPPFEALKGKDRWQACWKFPNGVCTESQVTPGRLPKCQKAVSHATAVSTA